MRRPHDRPADPPGGADVFHAVRRRSWTGSAMIRSRSGYFASLERFHPDTISAACTISTRHSLRLPGGSTRGSGFPQPWMPGDPSPLLCRALTVQAADLTPGQRMRGLRPDASPSRAMSPSE